MDNVVEFAPPVSWANGLPRYDDSALETIDDHVSAMQAGLDLIDRGMLEVAGAAYSARNKLGEEGLREVCKQVNRRYRTIEELELAYRRALHDDLKLTPAHSAKHLIVATRTQEPQAWLDRANDEGWSANRLRYEIKDAEEIERALSRPAATEPCAECGGSGRCSLCYTNGACHSCEGSGVRPVDEEVA